MSGDVPQQLLRSFALAIEEALARPGYEELLRRNEAIGVWGVDYVTGWMRRVHDNAASGKYPTPAEREFCNFYISKSGGRGVMVHYECKSSFRAGYTRGIKNHLSSLRACQVKAMGSPRRAS